MDVIKALVWKEYQTLLVNKKSLLATLIGCFIFIYIFIFMRLKINNFSNTNFIGKINYSTLMISYIVFISSLKFWHEKAMCTLEVLFMLPAKIITIIIGKMILPILVAQICSIIFYIISCCILLFISGSLYFSIITLLQIMLLSIIFQIFYSIINCYAMWCASLNYAKIIQVISVILYLGAVFSVIIVPTKINIFNSIGVWFVMGLIGLYSLWCLKKIKREKAILTLHY